MPFFIVAAVENIFGLFGKIFKRFNLYFFILKLSARALFVRRRSLQKLRQKILRRYQLLPPQENFYQAEIFYPARYFSGVRYGVAKIKKLPLAKGQAAAVKSSLQRLPKFFYRRIIFRRG